MQYEKKNFTAHLWEDQKPHWKQAHKHMKDTQVASFFYGRGMRIKCEHGGIEDQHWSEKKNRTMPVCMKERNKETMDQGLNERKPGQ